MTLTHRLRTFVLASVISLAAGVCATANAAVIDLGTIQGGAPTIFQGVIPESGPFGDTIQFILPPNEGSGYSVLNFPLSVPGGTFNTLFGSLTLVLDPDGTPYTPDDVPLKTVAANGNVGSLSLSFGPTSGGNMFLIVAGAANGTLGGLYSGAISVTPVPEPTVWVMMLAGIGLLGWVRLNRGSRLT